MEISHDNTIEHVCDFLRHRRSSEPLSLHKRQVSHQVPKRVGKNGAQLDISALDHVLAIDAARRLCVAEPGVPFDALVRETLKHGLVPKVVPELRTITVGGAVSGCSIESMSFRYGGFHDSCVAYEVVTAKGEVLSCTPTNENALVFQMMQNSFGTLGLLSKLTFTLVPAKAFVHVVYERYETVDDYRAAIMRHSESSDVDFMDGMIHSPTNYVLAVGTFVDEAPYTNKYDWLKVYVDSTRKRTDDYLKTFDYFFRYDHGVTNVHPKSLIGRFFLGKFLSSSQLLRMAEKLHRFLPKRPDVTVDVFLPVSRVADFLSWYQRELGHYPLWVVPYKGVRDYEWLTPEWYAKNDDPLFIDLAIYGAKQPDGVNFYRKLEEKLLELGGMKTLISHNYYTRDEFWQTYNRANYQAVKQRTDPDNIFRDVYDKMCSRS